MCDMRVENDLLRCALENPKPFLENRESIIDDDDIRSVANNRLKAGMGREGSTQCFGRESLVSGANDRQDI